MKQIKILGAGISGLTAAINLAKNGYKVDIYDVNKDCGARFNGDVQGFENWSEKEDSLEQLKKMGIDINFDCDPFLFATFTDCKKMSTLVSEKPLIYIVKRGPSEGTVDFGMKKQAFRAGVKIHFGKTIPKDETDIVATGPIFKEVPFVDKGIIFKTDSKDTIMFVLNDELAYEGYAYLFVTGGYGCIGTVVNKLQKANEYFEKTKDFFVKEFKVNIKSPRPAGGIGSFSLKHVLEVKHKKKDTLYIGEAAGLQDLLLGFGMRFAMESGYLAAQSIIHNFDYEKAAKKKFTNRLKAGMVNRYLWEKFNKRIYSLMINHPKSGKNLLCSMSNFNLVQRMIYPFALSYLKKKYPMLRL